MAGGRQRNHGYLSDNVSRLKAFGIFVAVIFVVWNTFVLFKRPFSKSSKMASEAYRSVHILSCEKQGPQVPALPAGSQECTVKQYAGIFVFKTLAELKANKAKSYAFVRDTFVRFLGGKNPQKDIRYLRRAVPPGLKERYKKLYFDPSKLAEDIMEHLPHDGDVMKNNIKNPERGAHLVFASFLDGFEGELTLDNIYSHSADVNGNV